MFLAAWVALRCVLFFDDLISPALVCGGRKMSNSPGVDPRAMPISWSINVLIGALRAGHFM